MNPDILIEQSHGGRDLARIRNLRYEILRKPLGLPFSETLFDGDTRESTIHLLATSKKDTVHAELVGVASLLIDASSEIQLRGMAVASGMQRCGVGHEILSAAKVIALGANKTLWCKSRFQAIGFYEREGWIQSGDLFDIPVIGQHIVMKWPGNLENNSVSVMKVLKSGLE
jgi:predicted GNAT family N-acyltransferase